MTELETNVVHTGDCTEKLQELPNDSVNCVVTSPPYFGLRDYGHDDQIGLENELSDYVEKLVDVFSEIRRILRPDGSAWLNLGDSYAGSGRGSWEEPTEDVKESYIPSDLPERNTNLGRKNKMLVPHRVAIALQEDDWIVRNDVTWVKPNPMPSPVKDRLNTTTEQIFHLVPEPDYWYDLDAIREPHQQNSRDRMQHEFDPEVEARGTNDTLNPEQLCHPNGKNPGDVFEVTTKPFPDAHFAVYPPELVEKPIKATCPQDGVVLDPFAGAGTTLLKAKELERQFIGIELNPDYADMARARVGLAPNDPSTLREYDDQEGLEAYQ